MKQIKILKDVVLSINGHATACVKGQVLSTVGINSEQLIYALENGYVESADKKDTDATEVDTKNVVAPENKMIKPKKSK